MEKIDVTQKQKTSYCIPLWLRDEQIKAAIKRVSDRIQPGELKTEPCAVVCYGPSLNDTWEQLKNYKYIFSCSGSHRFLLERGIVPTWHVEVDPREHKVELLGAPDPRVEYLPASACHPKYFDTIIKSGAKVTLWHIFESSSESVQVLPRGEWAITGGANVGLRAMTIARFFGFKEQHVFGMDGSTGISGMHAAAHPNQAQKFWPVEFEGRTFQSTPSLAECARQTGHELDMMPDVKATFFGDGLVQHVMKFHVPKTNEKDTSLIAFNKPELISSTYRDQNAQLHTENMLYGVGGSKYVDIVSKLAASLKSQSVLDYGCGKGYLAKGLPFPIWEYDPAIPEKSATPRPADLVVCTDVLEHIEPDKILYVLDDLRRCTKKIGYFTIHTGPAAKTLPDGRNTHLIQQNEKWWRKKVGKFFTIGKVIKRGPELHFVVEPK